MNDLDMRDDDGGYTAALETAAAFYANMKPEAQADVRMIAVTEMGSIQVVGTGVAWPSNREMVVEGPCMLVYAKDVIAFLTAEARG